MSGPVLGAKNTEKTGPCLQGAHDIAVEETNK